MQQYEDICSSMRTHMQQDEDTYLACVVATVPAELSMSEH
jgi:hypothetical protein